MAVSTTSYFSNSLVGVPQVAGEPVDVYEKRATPRFALGTKFERQDGAIFRYAHFSGVTSAGMVMASGGSCTSVSMITTASAAPSSTYQMSNEQPGVYPGSVGSRYLVSCGTIGAAVSVTANMYSGGYLTIASSGTQGGIGNTYRIKGNTATGVPAAGLMRFELYDPLLVVAATNMTISVMGSKYNDLLPVSPLSLSTPTVGCVPVGVVPIIQAAGYYGWVQTKGVTGVLFDASGATAQPGMAVSLNSAGLAGSASVYATGYTTASGWVAPIQIGTMASLTCAYCVGLVDVNIE